MIEIDLQVNQVAGAYLALRGREFRYLGVTLPLFKEALVLAIQNNIVGAILKHEGAEHGAASAKLMLDHMLKEKQLTELGISLLDTMNRSFCTDVRQMLDEGKDPMAELAREHERRATQ